ncbi:MAG: hypothetical protein P8L37_00795 [Phycisphaerales bacterium]|nr:hypothetical protein [Phycisphaerales bacterium]
MKHMMIICAGMMLVLGATGCKNTLDSVGDTAGGAVRGTGTIVEGVGEGVGHIGDGIGKDLSGDDGSKKSADASKDAKSTKED